LTTRIECSQSTASGSTQPLGLRQADRRSAARPRNM